ncbi:MULTISPECIES: hypothetical protein [Coriobacteriaceae]|jgi:hypothetical protein|uniref:hypothetical protein n=1 Tax=Coriobacteriaceae TaxID=84107 RepID=UPI001106DC0B|nr:MULTISPECIES: hypothetical protein [Collinsella]MDB1864850.1 hypothetical protein [Collinsella aerofaciens]MDB1868716.1 hypothetical protein [Collinsella aerofaciens]MDB1872839.1 hypothetical protein [Collinsella aerofaciens]
MIYYTDDSVKRVSRIDLEAGTAETYNFTLGRWRDDNDLWAVLVGELWLDEISQEQAEAIIRKRNKELHR